MGLGSWGEIGSFELGFVERVVLNGWVDKNVCEGKLER